MQMDSSIPSGVSFKGVVIMKQLLKFFCFSTAVIVIGLVGMSSNVLAQKVVNWTMVTPYPPSDPTTQRFIEFAKAAEKATDGQFTLKVLVAGQHPYQYRDGLRVATDGLADISHTGLTYLTAVESWFGLPFVPFAVPYEKQKEFVVQWHEKLAKPYLEEKYNLKVLGYFLTSGGWGNAIHTKNKLENFDSLKGQKIRAHDKNTAGLAQILGAIPATVPYSELYVAVRGKSIDGVMTSLQGASAQKLWELLKHTNLYEPYFGVDDILVSNEKWNALPDDLKPKIQALFDEWFAVPAMFEFHSTANERILIEAKEKYGAIFSEMSPEFRAQARVLSQPLLKAYIENGGDMAKKSADLANSLAGN